MMKLFIKMSVIIALIGSVVLISGCSGDVSTKTQSISQNVSQSTKAKPTEETSEQITDLITEPLTEKPTETIRKQAFQAYLDYLQNHPEWFSDDDPTFTYIMSERPIAFYDINDDGVEETLHYRPNTELPKTGDLKLCIVTYADGIKTLYDEVEVSLPGAEAGFSVFVDSDNKLYSVTAKELNGHVIRFYSKGTVLSAVTMADSYAHHLAKPEEAKSHIEGKNVTYQEFLDYRKSVEHNVNTYLLLHHYNYEKAKDVSMSYSDACAFLKKSI